MNDRLHSVLAQRGISPDILADVCAVDPKTVSRWLGGRVPHARHRFAVARHLRVEETFLWPAPARRSVRTADGSGGELLGTYPNRASVPRDIWLTLLSEAKREISVLVFSGTFFAQSNPHVAKMLAARASEGVRVRLCFGDPAGRAVATRGREEGIGDTLAAKIRASLTYYRPLLGDIGCSIRLHDATLYASMFRYDDDLLVNPHVWGQPASANPLFHLRRADDAGWVATYAESFEAVWADARPWIPEQ
ncbi:MULTISPECIES: XRE family transcriptional regulator [unclassified Streptomyces]|uniref:XRE family transcriptional regulator n=1 Tax=unclassified Streptomyces TaxID=2593676 RepID=UPI0019D6D4AF|nr:MULTISPECIES: XRE family transcriptional regulator [unclassified Streptomyces]